MGAPVGVVVDGRQHVLTGRRAEMVRLILASAEIDAIPTGSLELHFNPGGVKARLTKMLPELRAPAARA